MKFSFLSRLLLNFQKFGPLSALSLFGLIDKTIAEWSDRIPGMISV